MKALSTLLGFLLLSGSAGLCAANSELPSVTDSQGEDQIVNSREDGQVELPRGQYDRLIDASRQPRPQPRPAPAPFALGKAQITIVVDEIGSRPSALVSIELPVSVYENQWNLVPLLPPATAVESASADGSPLQLLATPEGMAWSMRKPGTYTVKLVLRVDASRSEQGAQTAGYILSIPLPQAASSRLVADVPGTGLDITLLPAVGSKVSNRGAKTRIEATLPTTRGVQLSWTRPRNPQGYTLSRVTYRGKLSESAGQPDQTMSFSGELDVELYDRSVTLPLLPIGIALANVTIDGTEVPILVENGHYAVLAQGRGKHRIDLGFEAQILRTNGPPHLDLRLPAVPVSRFELTLPGDKEISVAPAGSIDHRRLSETTVATVQVPMSDHVRFSWTDALPADTDAAAQLNAGLFHLLHAEEGVLYGRALVRFEVRRGSTGVLQLALPAAVQIDQVTDAAGAVADWRIESPTAEGPRRLSLYLDRRLDGELLVDITYDLSLPGEGPFAAPLLSALDTERQRGMVALLSGKDSTLEPQAEVKATRVGENLLPAFVRDQLKNTVAHTFKYAGSAPELSLATEVPERQMPRFDARIDTLISLGEVTLEGRSSVQIDLKSGRLERLELELPPGVHLLHLNAPSLRHHELLDTEDTSSARRRIAVEFTQEMEGQFRLELSYEQIRAEIETETGAETRNPDSAPGAPAGGLLVPLPSVIGAEIEQGRLAIEALSAVEVRPATRRGLTVLDIAELPRQLLLRTTNPILQAYKYARSEPRPELRLEITHHRLLEVQEAAIDQADYRTLYTRDGLAVTTARFAVRNSRKQFLRLRLPEGSRVWSVTVDGQPEKPAASDRDRPDEVLIKILHSTRGFPVEVIYGTRHKPLGRRGSIAGTLPYPDILVTRSRWQVLVPDTLEYRLPTSNLDLVEEPQTVTAADLQSSLEDLAESGRQNLDPLRLSVPTSGLRYTFEKLYANQGAEAGTPVSSRGTAKTWLGRSPETAWFEIDYSTAGRGSFGSWAALLGTLALCLGVGWWVFGNSSQRRPAGGCVIGGAMLLGIGLGPLGGAWWPMWIAASVLSALMAFSLYRRRPTKIHS